jgi:RHS repeat-associated protein
MMNLGFYSGDYTPIGNPLLTPQGLASTTATANLWTSFNATGLQGLYNGNIAYWTNNRGRAINGNNILRQNAYVFQYDQLNRIRNAYYTTALGNNNGEYIWAQRITTTPQLNDFSASYDLNGNMKTMQRYDGNATLIDNLAYNYNYQSGQSGVLLDNKLNNVNDDPNTSGIANYDIDNQTNAFNYTYDNIGNLIGDVSEQIANIGWNREGKVISLTRSSGSVKPDFIFKYDVSGKRIYKQVMNKTLAGLIDNTKTTYTYYAYDGTGNLLATYDQVAISSPMDIRQVDANVFGSDRLGVYAHATPILRNAFLNNALTNVSTTTQLFHRTPGYKQYELKDHLGNVRSVITGIKVGVYLAATNTPGAAFYVADVVSENDYYPFGMLMTVHAIYRRNSTSTYKFGYNGKVMDNDWNGEGAMYDYGFRIYDPRICKFLSVDPLAPKYAELTPYQFASNTPIWAIDLDGLEAAYMPFSLKAYKAGSPGVRLINYKTSGQTGRILTGASNLTFGTIGLVSSFGAASTGAGSVVGVVGMQLSMAEMGVGLAQLIDGIKNEKTRLPSGDNAFGWIASKHLPQYADFINSIGGLAASVLTFETQTDFVWGGLNVAFNDFTKSPNLFNALALYDQINDVLGAVGSGFDLIRAQKGNFENSIITKLNVTRISLYNQDTNLWTNHESIDIEWTFKNGTSWVKRRNQMNYHSTTVAAPSNDMFTQAIPIIQK